MSRGTGAAVGAPLVGDGQFQEVGARRVGVDAKRSGADALGGGASVVTPSGGRSMKRIDRMIVDDIGLTDGKSLRALIVPRLCGDQDVGWREESRAGIAIEEVAALQTMLLVDGRIDPADEFIFYLLRGNCIVHQPAIIRGRRQVLYQLERTRVEQGRTDLVAG
jgi:hypothetical protein